MGHHSDGYDGTILPSCDISDIAVTSGAAAEVAADRKTAMYAQLTQAYSFMAIAAETMGAINSDGMEFLDNLGRRITQVTDDNREKAFLYQRLSVMIQRYNAVAILGTLPTQPLRTSSSRCSIWVFSFCFNPRDLYYRDANTWLSLPFWCSSEKSKLFCNFNSVLIKTNLILQPTPRLLSFVLWIEWINGTYNIIHSRHSIDTPHTVWIAITPHTRPHGWVCTSTPKIDRKHMKWRNMPEIRTRYIPWK